MPNAYSSFAESPIASRPYDGVSALDVADQRFMARQAQIQSLEDMFTTHQKQQAELERYRGETPNKLALSNLEGAQARLKNNPATLDSLLTGDLGEAQSKTVKGKKEAALVDSQIEEGKSTSRKKITSNELESIGNTVTMYQAQMKSNLLDAPALYKDMLSHLPENVRSQFPSTFSPAALAGMGKLQKELTQTIPQLQAMEKEQLKRKTQLEQSNIAAAAQRYSADQRAKAKNNDAESTLKDLLKKDPRIALTGLRYLAADTELLPSLRIKVEAAIKQAELSAANMTRDKDSAIPGLPDPIRPNFDPSKQESGNKTPEGYDILEKNEDGSFKIRDPKTGRTGTYKP